jgi:small-conductance mechanosensitive channel
MHIVAIAWLYVVLMMSITEQSVVAGIMTFLLYGVFPLAIILYLMGSSQRKRGRAKAEKALRERAIETNAVASEKEERGGEE